jgi:hypothetical protein
VLLQKKEGSTSEKDKTFTSEIIVPILRDIERISQSYGEVISSIVCNIICFILKEEEEEFFFSLY